jgi:hypothetical protein
VSPDFSHGNSGICRGSDHPVRGNSWRGFLRGLEGLPAAAGLGQVDCEIVHRHREVGQVSVTVEPDQLATQGDRPLGGVEGLRAPAYRGEANREGLGRGGETRSSPLRASATSCC